MLELGLIKETLKSCSPDQKASFIDQWSKDLRFTRAFEKYLIDVLSIEYVYGVELAGKPVNSKISTTQNKELSRLVLVYKLHHSDKFLRRDYVAGVATFAFTFAAETTLSGEAIVYEDLEDHLSDELKKGVTLVGDELFDIIAAAYAEHQSEALMIFFKDVERYLKGNTEGLDINLTVDLYTKREQDAQL